VDKINQTKSQGGRIIAVGTTVVRALEGAALANQNNNSQELSLAEVTGVVIALAKVRERVETLLSRS
ncbi:MAG: S-adenosylmethionine:tRNA ribosyltransferase-isomerase, partial [Okeania sp. SIO2D1]|nr:S-adenosylmethionine:tRNA ribosyltransferase-isomerase [Okeania sp. SIO2D1]